MQTVKKKLNCENIKVNCGNVKLNCEPPGSSWFQGDLPSEKPKKCSENIDFTHNNIEVQGITFGQD